jgi:cell wall-associated NlpC family hydrolase
MSGSVSSAVDLRARVVAAAKDAMIASADADYTPNGRTVEGFDCSGFVSYVLQQVFPAYEHKDTSNIATSKDFFVVKAYRPGDLIFFPAGTVPYEKNSKKVYPNHVGIVVDHGHWIGSQTSTGTDKVAINNVWWGSRPYYFLSYTKLQ